MATSSFLALPAEIRNSIYEYALAPTGTLHLYRRTVSPTVAPGLLATCRQIHFEARRILYAQNSVCIVSDGQTSCTPAIPASRLSSQALENLEQMCLIFDCTATFRTPFNELDLSSLPGLKSLKRARIAVVLRTDEDAPNAAMRDCLAVLLKCVLDRLPIHTAVEWGVEAGSVETGVIEAVRVTRQRTFRTEQNVVVVSVSGADLQGMIERMCGRVL